MSNKLFTPEEVVAFKASPYVESVTARCVIFTAEFKRLAYGKLSAGQSMRAIFEDFGISTAALGDARIYGFRERLEREAARSDFTSHRHEPKQPPTAQQSLERRVKQLEHELAYARQEVEFLKKIQQADTEARKQWGSTHRPK